MMKENRYSNEDLLVRLRAIFGHVDQVRDCIDRALQQDNAHRRKRDMRFYYFLTGSLYLKAWNKVISQFG